MSKQALKDNYGHTYAYLEDQGDRIVIYNKFGHRLGHYKKHEDATYNKFGHRIGHGNILVTLLDDE